MYDYCQEFLKKENIFRCRLPLIKIKLVKITCIFFNACINV